MGSNLSSHLLARLQPTVNPLALLIGVGLFGLLMIAATWRIYAKAGAPGWASLVPIYNILVLLRIAGKPLWWFFLFFVPFVQTVVWILVNISLARNFGKGVGFGIGLTFLSPIFSPILGFGGAIYEGCDDV